MTIRVKKDRIEFVSDEGTTYTLRETGDGFSFDGVIEGTNIFQNGFQGTVAGFVSAGTDPSPANINTIQKFLFAVDTNATDVSDLTLSRSQAAGSSSTTSGYNSGGRPGPSPGPTNTIDKFSFATKANATNVGDLLSGGVYGPAGQSSSVNGYVSGGYTIPTTNTIQKFPFATDTNTTDVGDITAVRARGAGISSLTSGYNAGGVFTNTIDKFPFASDTNATDVGDLTYTSNFLVGQSSTTHGYTSGGYGPPPTNALNNIINKFPFTNDTNATDIGDLTSVKSGGAGQSSTVSGYFSGGSIPPAPTNTNTIEKFPFSADSNATDVGDLFTSVTLPTGQQD
jgi:hypothetical protein